MAIVKALELSTSHMPESDPDWGNLDSGVVADFDYGYFVMVASFDEENVPEWLRPILARADQEHCVVIIFDRNAEEMEEFTRYDW
jgi:hypothetical protein